VMTWREPHGFAPEPVIRPRRIGLSVSHSTPPLEPQARHLKRIMFTVDEAAGVESFRQATTTAEV
jgi:hypothetical protein